MSDSSSAGSVVTVHIDPTRCSKCGEEWTQGYGNMRDDHDELLCEAQVFRAKHHQYGMVSIEPTIRKLAHEQKLAPWVIAGNIEHALGVVYPRLGYKLFFRPSGNMWGAYVEAWGATAIQAFYDQGGYASLSLAEYLNKVADERHPTR